MTAASPWFSIEAQRSSGKLAVYHHNTCCRVGKKIEKNFRRYGTDNRHLCQQCARLDGIGK